jgi:hypothetical protein
VIDELGRELARAGIRGRQRERILSEFADHLACDPEAQLGDPRALAAQFAEELAADTARRSALWTFGALALVAAAVAVPQFVLPTVPDLTGGRSSLLVVPAVLGLVLASQIAFAAGCLAALRALRRPQDVAVVRRRTAVALAAGAATAAGSALYAFNYWSNVPQWWALLVVATAGAAALPLAAAAFTQARASAIAVAPRPTPGLSADLGPLARPALIGTAAVLAMLTWTAAVEGSLFEGVLRGAFEAVAFALCFFATRRSLALAD